MNFKSYALWKWVVTGIYPLVSSKSSVPPEFKQHKNFHKKQNLAITDHNQGNVRNTFELRIFLENSPIQLFLGTNKEGSKLNN